MISTTMNSKSRIRFAASNVLGTIPIRPNSAKKYYQQETDSETNGIDEIEIWNRVQSSPRNLHDGKNTSVSLNEKMPIIYQEEIDNRNHCELLQIETMDKLYPVKMSELKEKETKN